MALLTLTSFGPSDFNITFPSFDIYGCSAHYRLSSPTVTSRTVVGLFLEQIWFEIVPVFHDLQRRLAAQG
jgi:hypothetical protein